MLSPDTRTFITSPRHRLFKEGFLNVPTPEATPEKEGNVLTLLRFHFGRFASWIWDFIRRKDDEQTPPEVARVAIIVEYSTEVGGFSDSGYSDNRLQ